MMSMATHNPAVKKSVTIDRDVLDRLATERTRNFSATVNEGLRLLAALDAQQALVDEWEAEHGPFFGGGAASIPGDGDARPDREHHARDGRTSGGAEIASAATITWASSV